MEFAVIVSKNEELSIVEMKEDSAQYLPRLVWDLVLQECFLWLAFLIFLTDWTVLYHLTVFVHIVPVDRVACTLLCLRDTKMPIVQLVEDLSLLAFGYEDSPTFQNDAILNRDLIPV